MQVNENIPEYLIVTASVQLLIWNSSPLPKKKKRYRIEKEKKMLGLKDDFLQLYCGF